MGDLAGQAHLGRSRNEQAVTALRLWIRARHRPAARGRRGASWQALVDAGPRGRDAVMPGYTHTRAAEPITFGHLAAAHAWALVRDHERLRDARRRVERAAPRLGGAGRAPRCRSTARRWPRDLGFEAVSENALDAVMDRDFAAEFVFACAQLQTHLARLAEDLIWLSAPEFGFFALPEAYTTGSSLMPQKKNPDALELVRGKAARVDADLLRLLALMKGLPAGYQKDLQEDKEAVFDAADTTAASLAVMTGVVAGLGLDREAMRRAAAQEDDGRRPGRGAGPRGHALPQGPRPGRLWVAERSARARACASPRRALHIQSPAVAARLAALFDPAQAVAARTIRGGTAPEPVKASLDAALGRVRGA